MAKRSASLPKGISHREAMAQAKSDPLLDHMIQKGIPLTRKNYLDLSWPDRTKEDEADAEFESQIPAMFRKKSGKRTFLG